MNYPYACNSCAWDFEVIKSVRHIEDPEVCPSCGSMDTYRYIGRTHFYGATVEDAEFSPAFGQVVKGRKHREELAKRNGMIEVGNEDISKIHSSFDREREKKLATRYDELVDTSIKVVSQ